jgi:nucleotide-binding universal stress UspA family protein
VYRQIVVPLDGSRFAEAALPIALDVSRRTEADVRLVTVQEPIPSFAYDEWEAAASDWSEDYLANVIQRIGERAGGTVSTSLRTGPVVERLHDEVEEVEADLVVMATHGRGMLSRAWLGSVADGFVHLCDRPVLLVRPEEAEEEAQEITAEAPLQRMLIPLDGSELSEAALEHAVQLGSLFGCSYHLVRIVPYPVDIASPYLPHTVQMNQGLVEEACESAREYLEARAERLRRRDLEVDTGVFVDAQPGRGILREAEERSCDFIAMSTHGRKGLTRAILGSTSDKVLRGTRVPVLLYRPPE